MREARALTLSERSTSGALAVFLLVLLCLLPVVYVLSIGPAFRYVHYNGLDPGWLRSIYLPIDWLHDHCQPARRLIEWYLEWWR